MTKETDSIIAFHEASDVPGDVTDINTPDVHSSLSFHYNLGTRAPSRVLRWCWDWSTGIKGTAVDFGFKPIGRPGSPDLKAIHDSFMRAGDALQECIYVGPGVTHVVFGGKLRTVEWLQRNLPAVASAHRDHVHVAVRKGMILHPPERPSITAARIKATDSAIPAAPHPLEEDEDMCKFSIEYKTKAGHFKTEMSISGGIENYGTPFFGSIHSLKPENRKTFGPTDGGALTAVDSDNPDAGYICWNRQAQQFRFDAETKAKIDAGEL
jgi:hypothetical protein